MLDQSFYNLQHPERKWYHQCSVCKFSRGVEFSPDLQHPKQEKLSQLSFQYFPKCKNKIKSYQALVSEREFYYGVETSFYSIAATLEKKAPHCFLIIHMYASLGNTLMVNHYLNPTLKNLICTWFIIVKIRTFVIALSSHLHSFTIESNRGNSV